MEGMEVYLDWKQGDPMISTCSRSKELRKTMLKEIYEEELAKARARYRAKKEYDKKRKEGTP